MTQLFCKLLGLSFAPILGAVGKTYAKYSWLHAMKLTFSANLLHSIQGLRERIVHMCTTVLNHVLVSHQGGLHVPEPPTYVH